MEIWCVFPSADPVKAADCLRAWSGLGYKTAVLFDDRSHQARADVVIYESNYAGYPSAIKKLCDMTNADIIIAAGDDMYPDRHSKDDIDRSFTDRFKDLYGVMQPVGDNWNQEVIRMICGSPWMGRKFIKSIYNGNGPFWHEYYHYFCDREMYEVTKSLGILWQRQDLSHEHLNWHRLKKPRPAYLAKARSLWSKDRGIFERRRKEGFPGMS